ncbi:rRNA-processing protein Fcf2p [Monosporozyma unispora]|nr:hypothetical protein C6P44_005307 [Kazachstania unispora]
MSVEEQQSLEDLFASLKEVSKKGLSEDNLVTKLEETHDSDVLQLDDDEEGKKDTEKIFRDIEMDLKKLPKLHNDFDKLASKKFNKEKVEKSLIDVLPTTVLEEAQEPTKTVSVGKEWFTLPKPSDHMKKQVQRDLLLIKHRAALDPKRHYKKDKWQVPDRFSIGTIVEDKTEFFSSRLTNKQRKSTILETLMTDDQTNKYFKRKYSEIQVQKTSGKRGHYKKNKDMRRKF